MPGRWQVRSTQSLGCPWAHTQHRRAADTCIHCTYLQLLGQLFVSCTPFRACPRQVLDLGWKQALGFLMPGATSTAPSLQKLEAQLGVLQCPLKVHHAELTHRYTEQVPLEHPELLPNSFQGSYACRVAGIFSGMTTATKSCSEGRDSTSGMDKWSVSAGCCSVIADYPMKINVSIKYQPSRPSQGVLQEVIKQLKKQFPWVVCKTQAVITTGH